MHYMSSLLGPYHHVDVLKARSIGADGLLIFVLHRGLGIDNSAEVPPESFGANHSNVIALYSFQMKH